MRGSPYARLKTGQVIWRVAEFLEDLGILKRA